jgi:peptidoglycan-N-acetylglucosamine deacetylase
MTGVSLTFDVDGEAGLAGGRRDHRLTSRSEARYGITRGLPRILDRLARHDVLTTFYVPGVTCERHPEAIREVLAAGHEVGHHGHRHLRTVGIGERAERDELERGLAALEDHLGVRPAGYRSPTWELTPTTLALLPALGFGYDSSLMEDDLPYRLDNGLLELPVHWSLDDAPSRLTDPAAVLTTWLAAVREEPQLTFTMHPEIIGRPTAIGVLDGLLDRVAGTTLTHAEAAEQAGPTAPHV